MKRIIWGDYIDAYLNRNDEKTIIDQECEHAAEEGVLSEQELEQVHEEMLDELYNEQEKRKHAYQFIAEHIWDAALVALDNGNLAESMAIGDVYNQWLKVCEKAGVM